MGTLDGRPVVIEADDSGLVLSFAAFRTAWSARKMTNCLVPALRWLRYGRVPLKVRVAGLLSVELLPNPSTVLMLLAPALHRLG
jgi:hypothetical protein